MKKICLQKCESSIRNHIEQTEIGTTPIYWFFGPNLQNFLSAKNEKLNIPDSILQYDKIRNFLYTGPILGNFPNLMDVKRICTACPFYVFTFVIIKYILCLYKLIVNSVEWFFPQGFLVKLQMYTELNKLSNWTDLFVCFDKYSPLLYLSHIKR